MTQPAEAPAPPTLLAITPGDHGRTRDLGPWLDALGAAGLPAVSLREPHLPTARLDGLARRADAAGIAVYVHDRHPDARQLGRALHLPAHGSPPPRGVVFGQSCHDADELDRAFAGGASWALLSPVWSPTSKPGDVRMPLGLRRFVALAAGRPVLALGGVDGDRLARIRRLGYGAAVCGGLFEATSPAAAAVALVGWLAGTERQPGHAIWNRSSS